MQKQIILSAFLFCILNSVNAQEWLTDIDAAQKIALQKNQHIILVFQGSDWCAPCIKLEKEIWNSHEFKTYAKDNYVLVKADFPRKKKNKLSKKQQAQNIQLMEKYNTKGYFPFVAVIDKKGEMLGNTGYKKIAPTEYIKLLNSFN